MKDRFVIHYLILVILQLVICNFLHLSPYLQLSVLPALVFCLPAAVPTAASLLIAFATGLTVDFLAEGVIGPNALALVPVAYFRKSIYRLYFGEEFIRRGGRVSVSGLGTGKVSAALITVQALYLLLYLWTDGAEAHPFTFNLVRFTVSLAVGTVVSFWIADLIQPKERR